MLDGPPLLRIKVLKVSGGYGHESNRPFRVNHDIDSCFVRNNFDGLRPLGPQRAKFKIDSLIDGDVTLDILNGHM
jgi:hypothetical protein